MISIMLLLLIALGVTGTICVFKGRLWWTGLCLLGIVVDMFALAVVYPK